MAQSKLQENLKYIRAAHGLTQKEMAAKIGILLKTYAKYEEGTSPSMETLIDISIETNISTDMLLKESISATKSHDDILKLLAKKGI